MRELVADAGRRAVELAAAGAGDGLAAARDAVAARKDPARKHAKRVRRAQRRVRAEATLAGGLGAVAVTAGVAPGWGPAEIGFGGAAAVVAVTAVGAAARLRELRRTPVPAAPPRAVRAAARPPKDSPARRPLDRLAERERALAGLLGHLGDAGDEARGVAADAAAALRDLGARTTAVHQARRGAGAPAAGGLDAALTVLVQRLEEGVAAYDALVVAAADAVAASATLRAADPVLLHRLDEATDSLAGLAAGLHEVAR